MNNTEAVIAPTLRQRLLSHVLLPVFVVWLTSTALIMRSPTSTRSGLSIAL